MSTIKAVNYLHPSGTSGITLDARGNVTAKANVDIAGFLTGNGSSKSISDVLLANNGTFPRKFYPTTAYVELLRLSPGVTVFESADGTQTNCMNGTYFREVIREMANNGIQNIVVAYVEYQGFWFYTPGFTYPYDWETSRTGKFWTDWLTSYPNVVSFNPVETMLDECEKLSMSVYLGLGRNGDTELLNDLYKINTAQPDPNRYGLNINTRLSNATTRTRQVAADLISQFGGYKSFAGFYITHESDHIATSNNYFNPVTSVAGVHPAIRSYGKPIMTAPGSPIDLAATSTFASALVSSGIDIFMPQDSVGPGADLSTNSAVYTYIPSVTIPTLAGHFDTWRKAVAIANSKQTLTDRYIRLWSTTETWQMGVRPATTLTLSALSGATVTATAGAAAFASTDVGRWIHTADKGRGKIVGYTSATVVTVDTTVTSDPGGNAYGSLSQTSGNWSINDLYSKDYPADISRLKNQLYEEWPYIESICLYHWFGTIDSGTLSLRLAQANAGRTDYRTLAAALYSGYNTWYKGQKAKYLQSPTVSTIQQQYFERGAGPAGGSTSLTDDFANFYPLHDGSRVTYICVIRGYLAFGTSTLTLGLRVNGSLVKSTQDLAASNYAGGTYVFVYSELPKGLARTVGISYSSTSANFNLSGVEIYAVETV